MPDSPDDFDQSNVAEFTAMLDSSELAARLYSPVMYGRSGQVIFATDFSRGFSGYFTEITGASTKIDLQTQFAMANGLALRMYSHSNDDSDCYIGIGIPYVEARYYTLDVGYYQTGNLDISRHELYVQYEGIRHHLDLRHQTNPFNLKVKIADGTFEDITALESSASIFGNRIHLRVTLDTRTGKFALLSINNAKFAVTDLEYYQVAGSYGNDIQHYDGVLTNSGFPIDHYLLWVTISVSNSFP